MYIIYFMSKQYYMYVIMLCVWWVALHYQLSQQSIEYFKLIIYINKLQEPQKLSYIKIPEF